MYIFQFYGSPYAQVQYTLVEPKKNPTSLLEQPVDPTRVVYAEVDKTRLAPKLEESLSEAAPGWLNVL